MLAFLEERWDGFGELLGKTGSELGLGEGLAVAAAGCPIQVLVDQLAGEHVRLDGTDHLVIHSEHGEVLTIVVDDHQVWSRGHGGDNAHHHRLLRAGLGVIDDQMRAGEHVVWDEEQVVCAVDAVKHEDGSAFHCA